MSTEQTIFAVVVVIVAAILWRNYKGGSTIKAMALPIMREATFTQQEVQSIEADPAVLLVNLTDLLDANGKLASARRQTTRLTEAAADGHDARFAATLGPKAPPASSPPPA